MNDGKGPYNGIEIENGECINQVGKRLGTALTKLRPSSNRQDNKNRKN